MENPIDIWGNSLDRRIAVYNEQRSLVERQFAELSATRAGLDAFGEELKAEIEAYQSAKTQQKPVKAVPGSIPPLRPSARDVPVIRQETASEGIPDAEDFFAAEEPEEEEAPTPVRPQPVGVRPPSLQKPQPIVPQQAPEPVKGSFDSKALFNRLK